MTTYTFKVNGHDYSGLVERDSYATSLSPVYGETIQTIDGVGHTAMLRKKGTIRIGLNPQNTTDTKSLCDDLLDAPCEVQYHCLQRNLDVTALMTIDSVSATNLSRCKYLGESWNELDRITLTEL